MFRTRKSQFGNVYGDADTAPWGRARHRTVQILFLGLPLTALAALLIVVAFGIRASFPSDENGLPARLLTKEEIQSLRALLASRGQPVAPSKDSKADPLTGAEVEKLRALEPFADKLSATVLTSEEVDKLKEDVKRYLEWVIAIAGIFSIAQTVAAAYASQSFNAQAKLAVDEIESWKTKYRNLETLDEKQVSAMKGLAEAYKGFFSGRLTDESSAENGLPKGELVEWLHWRSNIYKKMKEIPRQNLLSVDRYLGFDLKLDQIPGSTQQANIVRMLANFYVSKYEYDEDEIGTSNWDDLERAEYLLRLWIQQHPEQFQFRNDLGVVLIKFADHFKRTGKTGPEKDYRLKAKVEFEFSAALQPRQQRAYFNLAIIAWDLARPAVLLNQQSIEQAKAGLAEAIRRSSQALDFEPWETRPDIRMTTEIEYNLACYWALLAYYSRIVGVIPAGRVPQNEVNRILNMLERVAKKGTIWEKYVKADFNSKDGDIAQLRTIIDPLDWIKLQSIYPRLFREDGQES